MKNLKSLFFILVILALTSCEKDNKESPYFFNTKEYQEFFNPINVFSAEDYFDSEWQCIAVWGEGSWSDSEKYVYWGDDNSWHFTLNYPHLKITESHSLNNKFKITETRDGEVFTYPKVSTSGNIGASYSDSMSSYNFFFVKKDIIVVKHNDMRFYKFIRVK